MRCVDVHEEERKKDDNENLGVDKISHVEGPSSGFGYYRVLAGWLTAEEGTRRLVPRWLTTSPRAVGKRGSISIATRSPVACSLASR